MAPLELRFIGTGNAFAPGGLCWNGFLANGVHLFEAPPQALMTLNALGIDPNAIETVVLSHHHGDHFLGLPFLLLHWKYRGRTRPVRIIGPEETEAVARQVAARTYPGLFDSNVPIEWLAIRPGERLSAGGLTVEAVEVVHDRKLNVNLGFACEIAGQRFGYTGDSALCDGVLDLARRSPVLVSECASVDEETDLHMNLVSDIPRVRAAMPDGGRLLLTHLGEGVAEAAGEGVQVARDFGQYLLP